MKDYNKIKIDEIISNGSVLEKKEIAKQGYGLDKLIDDKHWEVRFAVAEQGYGLDKLVNDEHLAVRIVVAKQGYGLDKLVNDEHWVVRREVAKQGYGLDKLINDSTLLVKETARKLKDAEVYLVERKFGTYKGNLYLYVWKDKYEIKSGCYETTSLENWKKKCTEQLDKKTANIYYNKMKETIGA